MYWLRHDGHFLSDVNTASLRVLPVPFANVCCLWVLLGSGMVATFLGLSFRNNMHMRAQTRIHTHIKDSSNTGTYIGISPVADVSRDLLLARAGLCTLEARRNASLAFFVKRLHTDRLPQHLRNVTNAWLSSPPNLRRSVRRASFILALPKPKKEFLRRSPLYMSFCLWNKVMVDLRWSKKELPTRPQLTQHCLDTE